MYITIIAVALIVSFFFTWYFRHKSLEKERRMLIENGFHPSDIPEYQDLNIKFTVPWLKIGCTIAGGAFGALFGNFLDEIWEWQFEPLFALIFFAGIGMIIGYYLDKGDKGN